MWRTSVFFVSVLAFLILGMTAQADNVLPSLSVDDGKFNLVVDKGGGLATIADVSGIVKAQPDRAKVQNCGSCHTSAAIVRKTPSIPKSDGDAIVTACRQNGSLLTDGSLGDSSGGGAGGDHVGLSTAIIHTG